MVFRGTYGIPSKLIGSIVFQHGQEHSQPPPELSVELLWPRALLVGDVFLGFFAEKLMKDDALIVGLLHDIGT